MLGLELVYLITPVIFVMIGGACYIGYKLDHRRHAEIRGELEARDALEAAAAPTESLAAPQAPAALATN